MTTSCVTNVPPSHDQTPTEHSMLSEGLTTNPVTSTTVYFSPNGGCESHVIEMISDAKKTIDIAVYSINNEPIVTALKEAKSRGVKIRILTDRAQAKLPGNCQTTLGLKDAGFDVRIHSKNRMQHNKFVVVDGTRIETGSFNWTKPAEHFNEENCVFLNEPGIVKAYSNRFDTYLWVVNTAEMSEKAFQSLKNEPSRCPTSR